MTENVEIWQPTSNLRYAWGSPVLEQQWVEKGGRTEWRLVAMAEPEPRVTESQPRKPFVTGRMPQGTDFDGIV